MSKCDNCGNCKTNDGCSTLRNKPIKLEVNPPRHAMVIVNRMDNDERERFFELLFEKYCKLCYKEKYGKQCHCMNDE